MACFDIPLFKSQTEVPSTETPQFLGWAADAVDDHLDPSFDANDPDLQTQGAWQRTLPLSSNGVAKFAGRFVVEQNAASAVDGCYNASGGLGPYDEATGVSGGDWWVNGSNIWGSGLGYWPGVNLSVSDDIGFDKDVPHSGISRMLADAP